MTKKLFITDFDGVICDSVHECLLITYNAYKRLHSPSFQRILSLEDIAPSTRERFRKLRAYLKGAEDFLPIFIAIENNIPITNQEDFNAFRNNHKEQLVTYQKAFYAERDYLQRYEKELWLMLNPLFEGIKETLKQCKSFETIYILTTKRQQDVLETFQYQGIPFPADHVIYMKAAGKSKKLLEILRENNAALSESVYIEDQVDFLVESKKHQIGSYLVEWGYVSDEQKVLAKQHEIPIIGVEEFRTLLEKTM
jgi:phosphoglycolate phosphatase-like HAD superfamily hydrolase